MADPTTRDLLDRLATLEGTVHLQGARLARYERRDRRGRTTRRLLPLSLAALLVALAPLATLAANPFNDLNPNSVHNPNIDAIYNAGITTGCDPNVAYCPNRTVTREEMASFLARTAGLGGNPPIANAKTAQTAQSATSATTAQSAVTAQTATSATSAQDASALGGVAAAGYVQTTSRALPLAYASIGSNGAKLSGTPNLSVVRTSPGIYSILIAGENFTAENYVAVATANNGVVAATATVLGFVDAQNRPVLVVQTFTASGARTDCFFNVVIFKP